MSLHRALHCTKTDHPNNKCITLTTFWNILRVIHLIAPGPANVAKTIPTREFRDYDKELAIPFLLRAYPVILSQ